MDFAFDIVFIIHYHHLSIHDLLFVLCTIFYRNDQNIYIMCTSCFRDEFFPDTLILIFIQKSVDG